MSAFSDAVEKNFEGLEAVSTGPCPGCSECASAYGYCCVHSFTAAYEAGEISNEPSFSWSPCDICGSRLGGDREEWHAVMDGKLQHFEGACGDCVVYLANGDEPERDEVIP